MLVVRGGTIWTGDPREPITRAVAAADGRVVARGAAAESLARDCPRGQVIDLAGGSAVPGLTDAHAHLVGLGSALVEVDLRGARSIAEVVERVRRDAPPDGWITGRGWDQNLWQGAAMPGHDPLTAAFPERPVWLRRVDGHAGWANAAALRAAGITAATEVPTGGEVLLRDGPSGREPTGVLIDAAMDLMPTPAPPEPELRRRLLLAQDYALARGLVGVHEMGVARHVDRLLRELAAEGLLKLRMVGYADESWFRLGDGLPDLADRPAADDRYALQGVKIYVDGALGSRGAALLQPYSDRPGHTGMFQHAPGQLATVLTQAQAHRYQVAAHAIGDAAIRAVLEALAGSQAPADHRLRVEHAQIVDLADIPRFAELGAIASMQPTHATSDMAWTEQRVGAQRLAGAYAWRRFLAAGVPLAFGSDFPVEEVEPTFGLYAAITRQDPQGEPPGGWLPDQRLTLDEALAAFTRGAAFAARRERWAGTLAPGMLADLTCFAGDITKMSPLELRTAAVRATIVGGEVVGPK
ncbi:amidohydrolase [Nannocystis bainbridge]|uniref:Amidohydrolase n=1 Tax=Nannocystis bainbridge TaxID=2995303 RepID=A0ABT5E4K6_9BACT|nr:amidohydrolase [Nannocystis bainbridge]MDC0720799.1 amidohydrolase [Nannocystis bainbridge]